MSLIMLKKNLWDLYLLIYKHFEVQATLLMQPIRNWKTQLRFRNSYLTRALNDAHVNESALSRNEIGFSDFVHLE